MKKRYIVYAMLAAAISGCSTEAAPDSKTAAAGQQAVSFAKLPPAQQSVKKAELSPEQKKALAEFNKKLNEASAKVGQSKFEEADLILKQLSEDNSVSDADRARAAIAMANSMNRQGKFAEALAVVEGTLAKSGSGLDKNASIGAFNLNVDILRKLERFDSAANTAFKMLSIADINADEQLRIKKSVIDNFLSAKNNDTALALAREIVADPSVSATEKLGVFNNVAEAYRRAGEFEKAVSSNSEAMNIPGLTPVQSAGLKLKNASLYMAMKPAKPADADKLMLAVIDDASADSGIRTNAMVQYSGRIIGDRKGDFAKSIEMCKKLAADKDIKPVDSVRIQEQIIAAAKKDSKLDGELFAATDVIIAKPEASNTQKINASWAKAEALALNDKMDEAMKAVRLPLQFQNLSNDDLVLAQTFIGRLLECQGKYEEALAAYSEPLKKDTSEKTKNAVNKNVTDCMMFFRKFDDAAKVYRDAGQPLEEARVYKAADNMKKARESALKVLADEKQPLNLRKSAYEYFVTDDPAAYAVVDKYFDVYVKDNKFAGNIFWTNCRPPMMQANYSYALRNIELAKKAGGQDRNFLLDYYHVNALAGLNRLAEAAAVAEESASKAYTPAERYRLALAAAMLKTPETVGSMQKAFKDVDSKFADLKKLSTKEISDAVIKVGRTAMIANKSESAKDIYKVYEGLYVPEPKKSYTMDFYQTPVSGIDVWESLKKQPPTQLMNRKYGGNMDFLVTDVSTGNRGSGIGEGDAAKKKFTEFSALCDVNGVHFLFTAYDDKAQQVEAKLLGAGAYEAYLAPGVNQPYFCFLPDLQSGDTMLWQTTYNNQLYRRPESNNRDQFRREHVFTKDGYKTYVFFSWDIFYDKLPGAGDAWEFENIQWGRDGGYSWNGTKSIHGRSTWGNLFFNMSDADRTAIKKKIIFSALSSYEKEKKTGHHHDGVISFWSDPVLGDPDFYQSVVKPYVEKLDAYAKRVKPDMSDADINEIFRDAVPGWKEIRFKLADMRRVWLEEHLTK